MIRTIYLHFRVKIQDIISYKNEASSLFQFHNKVLLGLIFM